MRDAHSSTYAQKICISLQSAIAHLISAPTKMSIIIKNNIIYTYYYYYYEEDIYRALATIDCVRPHVASIIERVFCLLKP